MSLRSEVLYFGAAAFSFLSSLSVSAAVDTNSSNDRDLANRHSPIVISRQDQISNPDTDRALLLAYSIDKSKTYDWKIVYTMFFSDEDSLRTIKAKAKDMARYGRKLDVEWVYAVRLNPMTGEVLERTYQCAAFLGIGHRTCKFRGDFAVGTDHPILYDVARHNVFGAHPGFLRGSRYGRRIELMPEVEIAYPKSRDMIPLEHPELMQTSDAELAREKRLDHPATEYLYLRLRGTLTGKVFPNITDEIGIKFQSSTKSGGDLVDMGLNLWGKESVVAIWLPDATRRKVRIGAGQVHLGFTPHGKNSRISLEEVGAYMVDQMMDGSYSTVDLSPRITCENPTDLTTCLL